MIARGAVAAEMAPTARLSVQFAIDAGAYFPPPLLECAEKRNDREEIRRFDDSQAFVREPFKRSSLARASRAAS